MAPNHHGLWQHSYWTSSTRIVSLSTLLPGSLIGKGVVSVHSGSSCADSNLILLKWILHRQSSQGCGCPCCCVVHLFLLSTFCKCLDTALWTTMSICVLASYWKVAVTVLFFVLESSVHLSRQQSWWLWSHTARPIKGSGKLCMPSGLISCKPSLSKLLEIKAWNSSLNKSIYNTSFTFWNGWQKILNFFTKFFKLFELHL